MWNKGALLDLGSRGGLQFPLQLEAGRIYGVDLKIFQAFSGQSKPCVMTGKAQTCSTLSWCRDNHIDVTGDDRRAFQVTQQQC